ncbi:Mss4-like protein [Bisporella sp. PMI_857]|nr:Mss4-like protein [Bisporella sp. PMI_857]
MAFLPKAAVDLSGGCFCGAIKYVISIPPLASRPVIPTAKRKGFGQQNASTERLPLISLDHCDTCRRVSGAVIQCWFICPISWAKFSISFGSSDERKVAAADVLTGEGSALEGTHLKHFSSSKDVHRTFCGRCGTTLTYWCGEEDNVVDGWGPFFNIAVGSFAKADLELMAPMREGHAEDAVGWVIGLIRSGETSLVGRQGKE